MKKVLLLNKPVGMTPLQAIQQCKQTYPEYKDLTLSYAGRLDPMAEGLLVLLVADENKQRRQYEDLQKEYVCEVLFGIATDSYDLLGKITATSISQVIDKKQLERHLQTYVGKHQQKYPPYSSKPVNGKPLYYWARNNRLNEIVIPTKTIEIYTVELLSITSIEKQTLYKHIIESIHTVHGDFRQEDILKNWQHFFKTTKEEIFPVCKLRVSCSSGTYIRSLANQLGNDVDIHALAFSIKRTKVGTYSLSDALSMI